MRLKAKLPALLLLLFLSWVTVLRVGDFNARMAPSEDIFPAPFAYAWQSPEIFAHDIFGTFARQFTLTTLHNWLPAVLLKTWGVPPEIPSQVFIYLQNVLIGFAMLRYTWLVTGQAKVGWLAVFFTYTAQPWCWNLSNYGSLIQYTYAGQLVLPFLLWAASDILEGHAGRAIGWLVLSGLIHPTLTLYMLVIAGGYWLGQAGLKAWRQWLARLLGLGIVAAICVAPTLYLSLTSGERVTVAEQMQVLGRNLHFVPWNPVAALNFSASAFTVAGSTLLVFLALRHRAQVIPAFSIWGRAAAGACFAFAGLLAVGLIGSMPALVQLTPLRATLLFALLTLPLTLLYLTEKLSHSYLVRGAAIAIILLYAAFVYGFAWGPILVLLCHDLSEGHLGSLVFNPGKGQTHWLQIVGRGILLAWTGSALVACLFPSLAAIVVPGLLALAASRSISIPLGPGWSLGSIPSIIALILAASAILSGVCGGRVWRERAARLAQRWLSASSPSFSLPLGLYASVILTVILIGMTIFKAWQMGERTRQPRARALYEAQIWARDNTPQSAAFIAPGFSWRSFSRHWTIDPVPHDWYHYTGTRATKQFDDDYLAFYGVKSAAEAESAYLHLDEAGLLRLAHRFGGDYIVRPIDAPLNFPEVYRNEAFVIYRLVGV